MLGNLSNEELPRASLAICKLLIQDCLMAGVNVLNTAVKKVGRPDLQYREKKKATINVLGMHTAMAKNVEQDEISLFSKTKTQL